MELLDMLLEDMPEDELDHLLDALEDQVERNGCRIDVWVIRKGVRPWARTPRVESLRPEEVDCCIIFMGFLGGGGMAGFPIGFIQAEDEEDIISRFIMQRILFAPPPTLLQGPGIIRCAGAEELEEDMPEESSAYTDATPRESVSAPAAARVSILFIGKGEE